MSVIENTVTQDVSVFLLKSVNHWILWLTMNVMNSNWGHIGAFFISVETFSHQAGSTLPGEEFHAEWSVPQRQGTEAAFKDSIPGQGSFTASSHGSKHLHPRRILRSQFPESWLQKEKTFKTLIAIINSSVGCWHYFFIHIRCIPTYELIVAS